MERIYLYLKTSLIVSIHSYLYPPGRRDIYGKPLLPTQSPLCQLRFSSAGAVSYLERKIKCMVKCVVCIYCSCGKFGIFLPLNRTDKAMLGAVTVRLIIKKFAPPPPPPPPPPSKIIRQALVISRPNSRLRWKICWARDIFMIQDEWASVFLNTLFVHI